MGSQNVIMLETSLSAVPALYQQEGETPGPVWGYLEPWINNTPLSAACGLQSSFWVCASDSTGRKKRKHISPENKIWVERQELLANHAHWCLWLMASSRWFSGAWGAFMQLWKGAPSSLSCNGLPVLLQAQPDESWWSGSQPLLLDWVLAGRGSEVETTETPDKRERTISMPDSQLG